MSETAKNQEIWDLFFLCPSCGRLSKEWRHIHTETAYNIYSVDINDNIEYLDSESGEEEFYESVCPNCDNEFSEPADHFLIRISRKTLEIIPKGSYWKVLTGDLKKLRNKIIEQYLKLQEEADKS